MRALLRRPGIAALVALCTVALSTTAGLSSTAAAAAVVAVPAGAPSRPSPPPAPDPSLQVHPLTAADGPLDNPLKGFARFYFPGDNQNSGYPHSIQWSYFGLSEVMTDAATCNSYNWSILDNALNETASYGNQAAIRFYLEYPGGSGTHPGNAIPHCFDGKMAYRNNTFWGTVSPDYDSPFLLTALGNFIAAFGDRYDGDPRIGFIHLGLIGLWGEWHTWPFDTDTRTDSYPNLMPTDAHGSQILQAYDNAFNETKLEVRYPDSAGGGAVARGIGYHDDSFCYREGSPLAGVTLPQSLGGADYSQLQRALNQGTENKWITDSMGGEVRPEIQSSAFAFWPGGSGQVDNMKACIELEHATWKINQTSQSYSPTDPNVAAAVRLMGYNLRVTNAYFNNGASATAKIGVQIRNDGVAPFYYPWTVTLGLKDPSGAVVKTWDTAWDLRSVQPMRIRAFPDWGVGSDPTYLDFGYPQYFQSTVDLSAVPSGGYQLVLQVKNPLTAISPNAKKLRFANATQNADGWLGLGAMTVGSGGGDNAPPSTPTNLTSPSHTTNSVALAWAASTDNVGVTGYQVFRGASQIATTTTTGFTDTGLAPSTPYTYTIRARDAAGNVSPPSAGVTVTTSAVTTTPGSYEAEAGGNTLSGGAVVTACAACSGTAKVGYLGNGGTVVIRGVDGGAGGSRTVTVYYTTAANRTATVAANGGGGATVSFPSTGDWNTVGSVSTTVTLAAGTANTITIANPSDWAPDVDRIVIGASTPPPPAGSYEAEAAGNTLSGGAVVASCPGCSGGAKVGYLGNGGTVVINGIGGGTGGARTITVYYSTVGGRSGTVRANAGTATTVSFPSTGDWNTVGSVTTTLTLAAGTTNTITVANASGWAPDIDRITVTG